MSDLGQRIMDTTANKTDRNAGIMAITWVRKPLETGLYHVGYNHTISKTGDKQNSYVLKTQANEIADITQNGRREIRNFW